MDPPVSAKTWKKTQTLAYPFLALMLLMGVFLNAGYAMSNYPFTGDKFAEKFAADPVSVMSSFACIGTALSSKPRQRGRKAPHRGNVGVRCITWDPPRSSEPCGSLL